MRAHARRGARRAEGGKERERQPSGVAEGGAKREREEEAFAPAVRQHAERAVLVVSQLTTLASWGWPAKQHTPEAQLSRSGPSWRLRCSREPRPKSPILRLPNSQLREGKRERRPIGRYDPSSQETAAVPAPAAATAEVEGEIEQSPGDGGAEGGEEWMRPFATAPLPPPPPVREAQGYKLYLAERGGAIC